MAHVEVWQATAQWLDQPLSERQLAFQNLAHAMRGTMRNGLRAEGGPYLLSQGKAALLIWTSKLNEVEAEMFRGLGLFEFFQPLVFVLVTEQMTAQKLKEKIEAGQVVI